MKLNKNYIHTFIFILVYLFAIYFWTQPLEARELPYGEYDAMSHFEIGDYMAHTDKSLVKLPPYIDLRYGEDNLYKPHYLWYPPPYHTSFSIIQIFGGDRVVPIFLLNTIMATFILVTVYFVIKTLFGFYPAILSSLLLIFSPRDFMPFLWGQWPERFGYAFIPIILYCFYKYFNSYTKEKQNPIYLYLTSLFLIINLLVHPLVFFHSVIALIVLYVLLAIKQKKFVFNWKHILISFLIFVFIFMLFPFQTFNIFPQFGFGEGSVKSERVTDLTRLFHWSLDPNEYVGSVPPSYFSYKEMHALWTLPFLILGLLFLILRRENRDLFLMAWLIGLYLVMHRDLIGKISFIHRSLSATAHIFAPITAIGAVYLSSIIKLPSKYNNYLKYALVAGFVYLAFSVNMATASNIINEEVYNPNTQSGFFTSLNSAEFEAAEWILYNVPQPINISILGIPHTPDNLVSATSKKIRWMGAASQHVSRFHYLREDQEEILRSKEWNIMLDYSMLIQLGNQEPFISILNDMQELEKTRLINHTLIYDKNNIRIYKYGN